MKKILYTCISVMVICWGCGQRTGEDSGHNESEKIQYTIYTPDWELFAEADPFIAGVPAQILGHFTRLSDFKPLEPVPVTVTFTSGETEFRQVVEKPARDGIYRFEIRPEKSGTGALSFTFQEAETAHKIEIRDVRIFQTDVEADASVHQGGEDNTNTIVFTKEQSWKTDFCTGIPEKMTFGPVIRAIAGIEPVSGEEMVVSAKTGGIVLMATGDLTEGSSVGKGQYLLTISGIGLAESNIGLKAEEARNNFQKAEADFERKVQLAKDKLIPEKELQEAKALYLNSKAVYENYRDNFPMSSQRVVSPMTGFIRQLLVSNGHYVEEGQALLVVSQDKNLMLRADVSPKYLPNLRNPGEVMIKPIPGDKIYMLEKLDGIILSVGRSLNPGNSMIPVTLRVNNRGGFTPGGIAEVFIRCHSGQPVWTLPVSAVLEEQGMFFVFVQLTPELFERREVVPGAADGSRCEILSGISGQDRVVTKGAVLVKLARSSAALDPHAGHVH